MDFEILVFNNCVIHRIMIIILRFSYFNVKCKIISDKSLVVCAPTGSGKTVIFEMAIVQLLMEMEEKNFDGDFKIIYSLYINFNL